MASRSIFTESVESPFGTLHMYASQEGLVKLTLPGADLDAVEDEIGHRMNGVVESGGYHALEAAAQQLAEYFAGTRQAFALDLDHGLSRGFARDAHEALKTVSYGSTVSYSGLATLMNRPGAARAVGTACGKNPLPIIVPCHRVLANDGGIGGYASDIDIKRYLLALEGVLLP